MSDDTYTLCPACETERTSTSFVGKICGFCHDKGRKAPVSEPQGPTRKPRRKVHVPAQAPLPPSAPANASEEPYTAPQFDTKQALANPQAELANRTLARRRLLSFIQRFRPKYDAGWVHKDICRRLERFMKDVEDGLEPRLLLMTPPRLGKSEIGSRHFTPFVLGHHPDWEIIAASHTTSLSLSFSRYIRDLLRDPAYHAVFPVCILDPNSQSTENWNLTAGGGYLAAGVGSAITGRGAHILVLDDLVKDIEAADSQSQRDAVWEWYISTAHSRLAPGGGVLGIMTSWSEDDWAGRIQQVMAGGEGDQFEIVRYPAINEVGDEYILADDSIVEIPPGAPVPDDAVMTRPHNSALHEARYTLQALLRKKANYIASGLKRMWDSLYQQNPTPDEGIYFSKEMFRYYVHAPHPKHRFVYQAWDFAISTGTENDWTVGVTIMQDEFDNLYVLDVLRFRSDDGNMIVDTMLDYHQQWGAQLLGVEDGQIWKTMKGQFEKRCQERKIYPAYEVLVPLTDKLVRANPMKGRMQLGKLYFPKEAAWFPTYQRELLRFPAGKHDDQCFLAGTLITMADGSSQAIENVRAGQHVLTPSGPKPVTASGMTHSCAEVHQLTLSNGATLTGTGNHPVSTERGWVSLDSLKNSDRIHVRASQLRGVTSWHGQVQQQTWKWLSLTARSIGATLIHPVLIFADTLVGLVVRASCIATSGRSITDPFHLTTSFTTETRTPLIMTSQTLSACLALNMPSTPTQKCLNTAALKNNSSTWRQSVRKPRLGTLVPKVWRGIVSMAKSAGIIANLLHTLAKSVGVVLNPYAQMPNFAGSLARTKTGTRTTLGMRRRSVLEQRHAVYNLTVADAHCYYANDVLVHNCDATAWCVRLTLSRSAPKMPVPKEMKSWKDKFRNLGRGEGGHMSA